jgi:hypothetical protein
MTRARFIVAATLAAIWVGGAALPAQTQSGAAAPAKTPELKSVLAGKKFLPPIRGEANVDFIKGATTRAGTTLVTKIQVRNMSSAPIPRLTIDETWYDKNNNLIPGGKGVINGLLQPGEIQTVEIRTPSNPSMSTSMLQFAHANGTIKTHRVQSFEAGKDTAAKPAAPAKAAPTKAAAKKKK